MSLKRNLSKALLICLLPAASFAAGNKDISGLEGAQTGSGALGTCRISAGSSADTIYTTPAREIALNKDGGLRPVFGSLEGYIGIQYGNLTQVTLSLLDDSSSVLSGVNSEDIKKQKGAHVMLQNLRTGEWMDINCKVK